ncbi:hypothetical protein [Kineococcus gypseus]|uniref:hypothetical protein n=1 Tax=Kineococcus gypseus TaxID=1637102 RepID=UPI003D7DADED
METSPVALLGLLARGAARALVALWWWGPHPERVAPGGTGRGRAARLHRRAWRTGRVLGWSWGLAVAVALVAATAAVLAAPGTAGP